MKCYYCKVPPIRSPSPHAIQVKISGRAYKPVVVPGSCAYIPHCTLLCMRFDSMLALAAGWPSLKRSRRTYLTAQYENWSMVDVNIYAHGLNTLDKGGRRK